MFLVRNLSENWHGGALFIYLFLFSEINESRANRAPVARVLVFDTSLVNHSHCSTGLVKLADLRLVGTEIESRSRHGLFDLSIGSNPE